MLDFLVLVRFVFFQIGKAASVGFITNQSYGIAIESKGRASWDIAADFHAEDEPLAHASHQLLFLVPM